LRRIVCCLLGLGACTGETPVDTGAGAGDTVDPLSWAIDEAGPYGVGYRTWSRTYSPGSGFEDRTVRINLWYPTTDTAGSASAYTVGTDEASFEDASLAPPVHEQGYPVHLHSHGHLGYGATSAFLARHFASHGWVFVAPDHTDNTLVDEVDPRPSEHYVHRPLDVSQALDALDEDAALDGRAHTQAVLSSGHSFGVYTTWGVAGATYDLDRIAARCEAGELGDGTCHPELLTRIEAGLDDPRVAASLPMAGTYSEDWFGDDGYQSVSVPVVLLAGSEDDVGQAEEWEQIEGIDYTWVELEGGCHQTFALGACSTLDPDEGFRLVGAFALALGRFEILGDSEQGAVLDGSESLSGLVEIQVKGRR